MAGITAKVEVVYQEIERVRRYIEYCMINYMTRRQTIDCLASHANIDPSFTETIWRQLEVEQPEFFKGYYTRLAARDQIVGCNEAHSLQLQLMRQLHNATNRLLHHQRLQMNQHYNAFLRDFNGSQINELLHYSNGSLQQYNGSNGIQHPINGSQMYRQHSTGSNGIQYPTNASQMHQQQSGSNGIPHLTNGSQMHQQQSGSNEIPHLTNNSPTLVHQQHNDCYGLQLRSDGSQTMMHQQHNSCNGLQRWSNGSQTHQQHNDINEHQHHSNDF